MSNYQILAGTQLEDFETIGDWTAAGSGGGSIASDSTYFTTGTKSLKITAAASGNEYATKTISVDLSRAGVFSIDVYIPVIENIASISLYLTSTTDLSKYFSRSITALTLGWNRIVIYKNFWSNTSADTWTTMQRLRVRVDASASGDGVVYFDNLKYGIYSRPKVILVSDDGYSSVYSEAYNYMKGYGLKGTCGLVGTLIDSSASYMTTAQVTEMYNAGWDMSNHTYHHTNLTTLGTQAEMETEIQDNENWLIAQGFTRNNCHKMFVYPNGGYNQTALDALTARGVLSARTIVSQSGVSVSNKTLQPFTLVTRNLGNTTTLASAKADVDNAISSGATLIFESHKFVPSPTTTTEFLDTDFRLLIDYIASKVAGNQIDMVTFSEWYQGLTQNRKSA